MKKCNRCGLEKQTDQFPKNRRICKPCRKEYNFAYKVKNKDRIRNQTLIKEFGITAEQYDKMHDEQSGLCAICQNPEQALMFGNKMNLAVDHCHDTGAVRGLLCANCNRGIGLLKDNPEWLRRAADYIEKGRPEGRP